MPPRNARRKKITDAEAILDRMAGNDPALHAEIETAKFNLRIAEWILLAREAAGLTRTQLAKLVATNLRVISRLEHADYGECSLTMLQRVATALHKRVEVCLVPNEPN